MTAARFTLRFLLPLSLLLLFVTGCPRGPKGHPVSGRVTKGGKPLEFKPPVGMARVVFIPLDEKVKNTLGPVQAKVETDGSFKVYGKDGKGLPVGKYKVCVYHNPNGPTQDELKGKFDETNTPFTREVKESDNTFEFDLDKPN